jgi:hypothetical protein
METTITIQVGSKNTGKTYYCKDYISILISKSRYSKMPVRALILDINNEYEGIQRVFPEGLNRLFLNKKLAGVYRFVFDGSLTENQMDFMKICSNYQNGTLIIENPCILFGRVPDELLSLLCTHKQRNVDIILNLLNLKQAFTPKVLQNADFFHLYKNCQPIKQFRNQLGEHFRYFLNCETLVDEKSFCKMDLTNGNTSVVYLEKVILDYILTR